MSLVGDESNVLDVNDPLRLRFSDETIRFMVSYSARSVGFLVDIRRILQKIRRQKIKQITKPVAKTDNVSHVEEFVGLSSSSGLDLLLLVF